MLLGWPEVEQGFVAAVDLTGLNYERAVEAHSACSNKASLRHCPAVCSALGVSRSWYLWVEFGGQAFRLSQACRWCLGCGQPLP